MRGFPLSSLSRRILFSFLALACTTGQVLAIPVENLYMAEVLVTDESDRQLRTGARAGLLQVLVRVSGNTQVEQSDVVRASLRRPGDYYYQFSYENTERTLLIGTDEVPAKLLRLQFEPSSIARLLREAGLPIWGSNRPSVLFWIAVNEGQTRQLLGENDASEVINSLNDQAGQRGVPILFPILDLEDAAQISTAEVWGAFHDRIEAASTRYRPDAILTARVQRLPGGQWNNRWSYRIGDNWRSLETTEYSSDGLMRDMVDLLADELAQRFALDSSRGRIVLVVEGLVQLSDYAAVSSYLEQLTPVLNSSIVSLIGDVAEFELQTEGQLSQLVELIQLDERMVLLQDDRDGGRMTYRWAAQQ